MKTRESGMPHEEMWQGFFDPTATLTKLGLSADCECVVDFGCGYGTFSIPAAKMIRGTVHALDLEPEMIASTKAKAVEQRLFNLKVCQRDFVSTGCGLPDASADYVMLFNILHAEEAATLLAEAKRVLRIGKKLAVMHWNYDPKTPRGPSMNIRLQPEHCVSLVELAGFSVENLVDLPPFHYGFVATPA